MLNFPRDPCFNGPIYALFLLFIVIPIALTYIISFPFFVLFPLGTVFLLRIIKTEPVRKATSPSRGLLAAQIITSMQRFRYRLTSTVSKFVENRLEKMY